MPPLSLAVAAGSAMPPSEEQQIMQLTTRVNDLQGLVRELSEVQTGEQVSAQANHQQSIHNSQLNSAAVAAAYALACSTAFVPGDSSAGEQAGWTQWVDFQAAFDSGNCIVASGSVH
jgi:hypothetical protein